MEEKEGDYIQVAQLAKSVSKEQDDITDNEITEEEINKEEKKLAASMLPKKTTREDSCMNA